MHRLFGISQIPASHHWLTSDCHLSTLENGNVLALGYARLLPILSDMGSVAWSALGGEVLDALMDAESIGLDFGERYRVLHLLGHGGQGEVYEAQDLALERPVAIKRSANDVMLWREARLLGQLAHPAIPQVYDRGRCPDGSVFVAMQLVRGHRLDAFLQAHRLDYGQCLRLFRSIVAAIGHAHERGILHRDLKPENIIVTDGLEAYLIDWGLAATGDPRAICGSPHFAAPEQLDGQVADRRADIFALGVLLYVIASGGALPYGRQVRDFHEFRRQRAGLARVSLRQRCPHLPVALERICDRAMAAQPGARYPTTAALIADLDQMQGAGFGAGRNWGLVWLVMVSLVSAAFVLGRWGRGSQSESEPPVSDPSPLGPLLFDEDILHQTDDGSLLLDDPPAESPPDVPPDQTTEREALVLPEAFPSPEQELDELLRLLDEIPPLPVVPEEAAAQHDAGNDDGPDDEPP